MGETPGQLPAQRSSFVGRERELAEIAARTDGSRCVTLTGPGGAGKTRLAVRVADAVAGRFEGGARFVELAPIADPTFVPGSLAAALGAPERQSRSTLESVIAHVSAQHMLIVLDNCEHVVDAARHVTDALLASCPNVHILATTREALAIEGETVYPVAPLAHPDPRELAPVEAVTQYEAVQLFVDRARMHDPAFEINARNAALVATICSQLDGLPLALELAAARVKVLGVEQIVERLRDRFKLLGTGSNALVDRQRTLRALIDWSYDLLDEHERETLQRLSIFAGSFPPEAAEGVCGEDALESVASLVDQSLVVVEREDERVRYRLLETIREYAAEKRSAPLTAEASRAHRDWFLSYVEGLGALLSGATQTQTVRALASASDNILAALAFSEASGDLPAVRRLAAGMGRFWIMRGRYAEAGRWFDVALGDETATPRERIHLLCRLCGPLMRQGDVDQAQRCATEALNLAQATGDAKGEAAAIMELASIDTHRGDLDAARASATQALELSVQIGDRRGEARALMSIANASSDPEEGIELQERARVIWAETGDQENLSTAHNNIGNSAWGLGRMDAARFHLGRALDFARTIGSKNKMAMALTNLGGVAQAQSDHTAARAYQEEALALYREIDDVLGISRCLYNIALLHHHAGENYQARDLLLEVLPRWRAIENPLGESFTLNVLGLIDLSIGDNAQARRWLQQSIEAAKRAADPSGQARALVNLSDIAVSDGELTVAGSYADDALALAREGGDRAADIDALTAIGDVANALHEPDRAASRLREALALAVELGESNAIAACCSSLAVTAVDVGDAERAAVLIGAADAIRVAIGAPLQASHQARAEACVVGARSSLGEAAYDTAYATGGTLSREDVLACAMGEPLRRASAVEAPAGAGRFVREGAMWSVAFAGRAVMVADARGMHYLAVLLAAPGVEVHASQMTAGSSSAQPSRDDGLRPSSGDVGPTLDARATAAFKDRVRDLESEIAEAKEWRDGGREERARAEMDAIVQQLSSAYGLGGRARRTGDPAERARKAVTNRIRDAIARIEADHEPLGRHLHNAVRTGVFCSYIPERPVRWET